MTPALRQISRHARLAALAGAFALACSATGTAAARQDQGAESLTVVGYTSEAALRTAVAQSGARVVRRIPALHVAVVRTGPAAAGLLENLHGIRYSRRPIPRYRLVDPGVAPAPVTGGAYEWQYAASHENLVPASLLHAASALTIAVIDTGADVTAPDLAAKAPSTWSVVSNSSNVSDTHGHGTFVASLAAGSPGNAEGIAGFGGDVKLLVIQAADSSGTFSDVDEAAAITYAVDRGAKIINMSFGGPATSPTEQSAVAYAVAHGVLLVAAAGNSAESGNAPVYPAALLQPLGSNGQGGVGLSVGASTITGSRASFSNYGSYISLAAPGENVFGALSSISNPSSWPRQSLPGSTAGIYGYASGTSFSSPEVAGAAAVVWAANPQLTATSVAAVIKQSASGPGAWNQELGFGVLDVAQAVASAQGAVVSVPAVTLTGSSAGHRVGLTWSFPNAISYQLTVRRDERAARILLGPTSATSVVYNLDPGHSYSFSVTATDSFGRTQTSSPYAITLPYTGVKLDLRTSSSSGRARSAVRFWSAFTPADRSVARAGRKLSLEAFDGGTWRRISVATTGRTGIASWRLMLGHGTYRIRVRYAGAQTIAPATSRPVTIRA
jgi:subtilisin family serine protease